jgi:hypothetical protein
MANAAGRGAQAIHGQNPQVYESSYWKEHCFALTGALSMYLVAIRAYQRE